MSAELSVTSHGPAQLDTLRPVLLGVYQDVYADRLSDPFFSAPRYWERLQAYAAREGFAIVTAALGAENVGYALGYPLPPGSRWWQGLTTDVNQDELIENGSRTFALTEIMIRAPWRRRGYARALHDHLLAARTEKRATLLVHPTNAAAQAAYASWGWRKLGVLKPFADSPTYDAMLLPLK